MVPTSAGLPQECRMKFTLAAQPALVLDLDLD
jgi:hypothetical protein